MSPVDRKGWSSMCRRGDFASCERAQALCENPRHGRHDDGDHLCGPCRRRNHDRCVGLRCTCDHADTEVPAAPARQARPPRPTQNRKETAMPTPTPPEPASVVEWADPPPVTRGPYRSYLTAEQMAELRGHPKRWGIVQRYTSKSGANSACTRLRKGGNGRLAIDPAEWEFTARVDGKTSILYGRYLGEPEA